MVLAGLGPVQLVAALRSVFDRPEPALAIQRGGLQVAVAVAPDFLQRAISADKRIVGERLAVRIDAKDLAEAAAEILRAGAGVAVGTLADRHVKLAVRPEDEARAKVLVAVIGRHLLEDDLDVPLPPSRDSEKEK